MLYIAITVVKFLMMSKKVLIYVAGPTAVGKTTYSIKLAKELNTEIISCDSRQCYKEMQIGTAVPSQEELNEVPHHFIQHKSIFESFDAGDFEREALVLLQELFKTKDNVVMVGGSGLYAKALMEGLDQFPLVLNETDKNTIATAHNQNGIEGLQQLLFEKDPEFYKKVDISNSRRLIRALEVCETSGEPYSSFLNQPKEERLFKSKTILLHLPRPVLYDRINSRVDKMIKMGLHEEAEKLYSNKELKSLKTVGYKEWFQFFDRKISLEEVTEEIKKNTRRYAKRQITWNKQLSVSDLTNRFI
jgi:tRNA dimethylallyltransferase